MKRFSITDVLIKQMLHLVQLLEQRELWDGATHPSQEWGDAGPTFSQEHWSLEQ